MSTDQFLSEYKCC